jgi:hypothetical protein
MSYPYPQQPPQGYAAPGQPNPAQYGAPQQPYVDPNAGQPLPNPYGAQPPMPGQFGQIPPNQFVPQQPPMQESPDVEDTSGMFGGAPHFSWDLAKGYVLGTPRGGQIIAKKITQQTNAETKQLRFYEGSNKPMMQIVVTLQTRERTDANDDGKRTIYVKGEMLKSARRAFEAKGAKDLEIGAWFYAANTSKNGGRNGKANVFDCVYARPGEPDPLAHLPAYVAPQQAAQTPAQPAFVPPQQPNYPVPGQQSFNPYGQGQQQADPNHPMAQHGAALWTPEQHQAYNQAMFAQGQNPRQPAPGPQAYAVAQGQPSAPPQQPYGLSPQQVAEHGQQVQGEPPAGYNPF